MISTFRLQSLDGVVLARTKALDVEDALSRLADMLHLDGLEICLPTLARFRLHRISQDLMGVEQGWDVKPISNSSRTAAGRGWG